MTSELKDAILNNPFTDDLMDYQLDEQAFSELCNSLEQLASAWKGESFIDKDVVMYMYHTTHIVRNRMEHFRKNRQAATADRLEDMFIELDKLFGEQCLRASEPE